MDIASVIGMAIGFGVVVLSAILMGAEGKMFLDPGAIVLVFGGTLAVTLLAFPMSTFIASITNGAKNVFIVKKLGEKEMIATLVGFADKARREGLLALEETLQSVEDDFLRKGIQLVVDGRDTELIRKILETEVSFVSERAQKEEAVFSTMGGYAPTMGIIGTVLGLIAMLSRLGSFSQSGDVAGKLGEATASAFIATFYGVLTANLVWLPFGNKLKERNTERMLMREIQIEGILAIQAGDNPRLLEEKLNAYLDPQELKNEEAVAAKATAAPAAATA